MYYIYSLIYNNIIKWRHLNGKAQSGYDYL